MFPVTTGYAASWAVLGLLQAQEAPSTPRMILPKYGSQCGVGEISLKNTAPASRICTSPTSVCWALLLGIQPDLQKQLFCEVGGWAEAGRPLPASEQLSEAMTSLPCLLQCGPLCYPERSRGSHQGFARVSTGCWGWPNAAGVDH